MPNHYKVDSRMDSGFGLLGSSDEEEEEEEELIVEGTVRGGSAGPRRVLL